MKRDPNLHRDHRKRLKNRFLEEGLSHFEAHNVLELLLFYAIPRQDTNELAHRLLDRFGSLSGVFDADVTSLTEIPGISTHTAALIRLLPAIAARDAEERRAAEGKPTLENVTRYLSSLFEGERRERVYALYFDHQENLIRCDLVHDGDLSVSTLMVRRLAETSLQLRASFFVLAHNHPDGESVPSQSDLHTTGMLRDVFSKLQIPLAEHYIYANGHCYPMIEQYRYFRFETDETIEE